MANAVNFNNIKKQYLTVTLADEKSTTILVGTPTKKLLNDLIDLEDSIGKINSDDNIDAMGELYDVCAKIMSRNKTNYVITKDYLEEIFDIEDIIIFLKEYMAFVSKLSTLKN